MSKQKHSGENRSKCTAKKTHKRKARKRVFQRGSRCKNLKTSVRNSSVMKPCVKSVLNPIKYLRTKENHSKHVLH